MFFLLDTVVQQRRGDRHSPRYKNTHSLSQHIGALQTEIQQYFRNVTDFSFSWKIAGLQGRKRRGTDFQLVPSQPTTIRDCCRQTVLQWHPSIYICIYLTGSCQVSQMKKDRLCHHIKSLSSFFEMTRWIRGGESDDPPSVSPVESKSLIVGKREGNKRGWMPPENLFIAIYERQWARNINEHFPWDLVILILLHISSPCNQRTSFFF